ncbi:hypothetical protein ACTVZO_00205 [Streptomyces sp. IBSNAI002]|uniref:hypothetical protein n=1 Tax=Streptomyces sp. IBSNAI002 TaxID=3457500 RepID=UPI003FD0DF51
MRYRHPALAIATALLALTGLGTTAHADNNRDNKDGGKLCVIEVKGDHNHNACGNIKYGHNATTGQGHSVTTSGITAPATTNYFNIQNMTSDELIIYSYSGPWVSAPGLPVEIMAGETDSSNFFAWTPGTTASISLVGNAFYTVTVSSAGVPSCQQQGACTISSGQGTQSNPWILSIAGP